MNLLQRDDFPAFLKGVLRIENRGAEGVALHRLTARQLAHLDRLGAGAGVRGRCNAGQQLALRTDAERIELDLVLQPGARKTFALAVCVDGVAYHPVCEADLPDGPCHVTVALQAENQPRRLHEVRLHLPPSRPAQFTRIDLVGATAAEPLPDKPRRLLCLGDSITQGMEALSPLSPYPTALATSLDAELLNQGIGGHVFDTAFIDALPFLPDVVTIAYGTNDWTRNLSAEAIQQEAAAFVSCLADAWPRARLALITPLWRACGAERKTAGTLADVRATIAATPLGAAARRCDIIAGEMLVPNEARYFNDGTHPNDLGFGFYSAGLVKIIGA